MLLFASKDVFIIISDQCIHITNNKYRLNRIKGSTKTPKKIITIQISINIYNVKRKNNIKQIGMKMRRNNNLFQSLKFVNRKSYPYGNKVFPRHYHHLFIFDCPPCPHSVLIIGWQISIPGQISQKH